MEELLNCIVTFINEARENPNSVSTTDAVTNLVEVFYDIEQEYPDYLEQLDAIFEKDVQLYVLVLSVLFFVFKKEIFLNKAEELCYDKGLSYDQARGIWEQIGRARFFGGLKETLYEESREMQEYLVDRLKLKINFQAKNYHIVSDVQKKRILMVTNTLLHDLHAPSRIVLEFCKILQEKMGYEVFLLVCGETYPFTEIEKLWLNPRISCYDSNINYGFRREYSGVTICGYQQVISANYHELNNMFRMIEKWQPSYAWYIGETSVISELLSEMMPMAAMKCTSGYPVSSAPVLVSYMQNDQEELADMLSYINAAGQKTVDIKIRMEGIDSDKKYSAKDFGFPESAFVIAVVGNRLDYEIDKEFLAVMRQILEQSNNTVFVIIGKCEREWQTSPFLGRVQNLGYCEDLYNVLTGTKLFLNPVRQGGGAGASYSLKAGVPIVTLGNCDVANAGNEFICSSLAEYPSIVQRYEKDKDYYEKMSNLCRKKYSQRLLVSNEEGCKSVLSALAEL